MSDFEKQVKALLDQAMQQPGVADIMEAYETPNIAMDAIDRAQEAIAPRWVVSTSASSVHSEH